MRFLFIQLAIFFAFTLNLKAQEIFQLGVNFDKDKSEITEAASQKLQDIISKCGISSEYSIHLSGHT
ncbi:MAG: hypothetical protein HKN16_11080, partial [Saprospiraceae bacterium]|nr:hypothetical protein [Saprospiraceae bacterium]